MDKKYDAGKALKKFVINVGVPKELTVDGSKYQNSPVNEFIKRLWKNDIPMTRTEPKRPNQNPLEGVIWEVQKRWFRTMMRRLTPDFSDDTYLNMELAIPGDGYGTDFTKARKRLRYKYGMPISKSHNNRVLDTKMSKVECKDWKKALLAANTISENMFDQFNGKGNIHVLFQDIIEHRYNGTKVKEHYTFIKTHTGMRRCRDTTKVVEVLVQWKCGSNTWVTLKDMQNSYHVQMA